LSVALNTLIEKEKDQNPPITMVDIKRWVTLVMYDFEARNVESLMLITPEIQAGSDSIESSPRSRHCPFTPTGCKNIKPLTSYGFNTAVVVSESR